MVLLLYSIFNQRPMTDRKIERSNGRCFGPICNDFSPLPSKFSFHMKKKCVTRRGPKIYIAARYLQSMKTLSTLELSQYHKSGSIFSSSELVAACSD